MEVKLTTESPIRMMAEHYPLGANPRSHILEGLHSDPELGVGEAQLKVPACPPLFTKQT